MEPTAGPATHAGPREDESEPSDGLLVGEVEGLKEVFEARVCYQYSIVKPTRGGYISTYSQTMQ